MRIAYCTITNASDLPKVEVLKKSMERFVPSDDIHILLCERPAVCEDISSITSFKFVSPADIGCDQWLLMAFYYDVAEYKAALKPFLLEKLVKDGYQAVVYFDPNIEIYTSLTKVIHLLNEYEVILTPHVCHPVEEDGKIPAMEEYLRAGQYNLGFIAISDSDNVRSMLSWWQSVLLEKCKLDTGSRYFVDQFWAAAIPSFIDKVYILRDPAYNMAYWNIFQRKLDLVNDAWVTDSGDLQFFNFAGLNQEDLTKVSIHQDRITAPIGSPLYQLLTVYFERIRNQEWAVFCDRIYSFAKYNNGEPITYDERKTFLAMSRADREVIGNPFDANNRPDNVIRIECQKSTAFYNGSDLLVKAEIGRLKEKVNQLEKRNKEIFASLSWRVTSPLRWLHNLLTGTK